jgi:Uroporphyrinogen decarboxylase (URO-D)
MTDNNKLQLSLNLMPSFYHKHLGMDYGAGYYFDPVTRSDIEANEQRFLYEILGKYGVGSKKPQPSTSIFIQAVDLILATQGADVVCPIDATLETWGNPWATLTTEEVNRIDPAAAAHHSFIDGIIAQYHEMLKMYGDKADILGIKEGNMTIHTPYTTAHQLCGEELFCKMIEAPQAVRVILMKIWQIYQAVYGRLQKELNAPAPTIINMGDCSACMLSADLYRKCVLPVNIAITAGFQSAKYHSCGSSTHLLNDFSKLPKLWRIELGEGTDLNIGVKLFPGISIAPLLDPVQMLNGQPEEVVALVDRIVETTASAPETVICAWALDRETLIENLETLCLTVNKYKVRI